MSIEKPQIFIIGAGISGCNAAVELINNGFDNVTILEAENRIGGRIDSIPFGTNGFIDLGAQWCQGEKGNSIYVMCKDFNFGATGWLNIEGLKLLQSNGENVDYNKYARLEQVHEQIISKFDEMKQSNLSFGEFYEEHFYKAMKDPEFDDIDDELCDLYLGLWQREFYALFASPTWYDVAAKVYPLLDECEGKQDMTWRKCGFKTVFDYIRKKLPPKIKLEDIVQLNKKVTKINWKNAKISIETADKSVYFADNVIVTVSLGVLQAHHRNIFNPILPESKIKAIESISMGTLGKVFLEFEEEFWRKDNENFIMYAFLWAKEDLNEIIGTDKEWLTHIIGFLHVDSHPNLLEALLSGDKMKEFETYSDYKIEHDCIWLLEKFLKRKLPRPISMTRTKWLTRENFLGAYSYLSMKSAANNIICEDLGEPIRHLNNPVLLFAGEATHTKYQGYAHGAADSGQRVANEIIDFYSTVSKL